MAYKKLKYWFDRDLAVLLADKILAVEPSFDGESFIRQVAEGTRHLELKDRVALTADHLKANLPTDYKKAIETLCRILGPENQKETGMFSEFYWVMPIAAFVEKYGLNYFSESMTAIEQITKRNTGEYCIRPFIEKYPAKTLTVMDKWSQNSNMHLRRLSSEGLRPRLPWAKKLDSFIQDPNPVIAILENLKDDDSRFVQKSVANNLNDILKDNLQTGMATIKQWSKHAPPNRKWIIKHALRTQVKKGNPEAQGIVQALK